MDATVAPFSAAGTLRAPSSKSQAHRLLVCSAIAPGPTTLTCPDVSQDVAATISCLEALGCRVSREGNALRVVPLPGTGATDNLRQAVPDADLDCRESGTTWRIMLALLAALGSGGRLHASGRLAERPVAPLRDQLCAHGAAVSAAGSNPLEVSGSLRPGRFELPGDVSSQFASALMLCAPLLAGPVEVLVRRPVASAPYLDMTADALRLFGAGVVRADGTCADGAAADAWLVSAPHGLVSPGEARVGGDWSAAAFWLAADGLGGEVGVRGLDPESRQADRLVVGMLGRMGVRVACHGGTWLREGPSEPRGAVLDVTASPDLVPPLAAVAALARGTTEFVGASRLRDKESDRIASVTGALRALGADADETPDGLVVRGATSLRGGTVDPCGDHRIAMMACVLATRCESPVTVLGAQCVAKSYPRFLDDLRAVGADVRREGR